MTYTTNLRLTYVFDSSYSTCSFNLSNDDINIAIPGFDFSVGVDHDFMQLRCFDCEDHDHYNLETPEAFLNKLGSECTGAYGKNHFCRGCH